MFTKTYTEATFAHLNYPSHIYYSEELILKMKRKMC